MASFPVQQVKRSDLPEALRALPGAPEVLYARGDVGLLERLPSRGLGVVGTRRPVAKTAALIRQLIQAVAVEDLVVVSGFARGVDTIAHEEAVRAGLATIAVLPSGHDHDYPMENRALRLKVLESGGLLITEQPEGTVLLKSLFHLRNRLIAAWSEAVLIAQAGLPSGALNTASWAREYGRKCFVVPAFPGETPFAGNQLLLDGPHRESALVYWGPHNLGDVWWGLKKARRSSRRVPASPDCVEIIQRVTNEMTQGGAAETRALLDEALASGWSSGRFYDALEEAFRLELLVDENGLLLKNPARSV